MSPKNWILHCIKLTFLSFLLLFGSPTDVRQSEYTTTSSQPTNMVSDAPMVPQSLCTPTVPWCNNMHQCTASSVTLKWSRCREKHPGVSKWGWGGWSKQIRPCMSLGGGNNFVGRVTVSILAASLTCHKGWEPWEQAGNGVLRKCDSNLPCSFPVELG